MEKMKIRVNGKEYDVEVEFLGGGGQINTNTSEEEEMPVKRKNPKRSVAGSIVSPIAGIVKEIKVKQGDKVEENTLVAVLEAMKMNTNVLSDGHGTVKNVPVKSGDNVAQGDVLIELEG